MRYRILPIQLVLITFIATGGCTLLKQGTEASVDLSYLYRPDKYSIFPRYLVYHEAGDRSVVFGKIRTADLFFSQANVNVQFQAELQIHYRLFETGDVRVLTDSLTLDHTLIRDETTEEYVFNFDIPAVTGKKYMLEIITTDLLRDRAVQNFIPVDKTGPFVSQNFMSLDARTGKPLFKSFVDSTTVVRMMYNDPGVDTLFLSIFRRPYQASRPPNLLLPPERLNYLPDTTYAISIGSGNLVVFPEPAIYFFRTDTNRTDGFALMRYSPGFPMVQYAEEMIGPLEYIATPVDYSRLVSQPNRKLSADNYWVQLTGNMDQARELIRIYYTRVYFGNHYFTSYKEGWKTERGMIYMIYGPPSILYKTDMTEEWIYGKEKGRNSLRFVFRREENPFSRNHYVLLRSDELTTFWSLAMESWRSGKLFYIEDIQ